MAAHRLEPGGSGRAGCRVPVTRRCSWLMVLAAHEAELSARKPRRRACAPQVKDMAAVDRLAPQIRARAARRRATRGLGRYRSCGSRWRAGIVADAVEASGPAWRPSKPTDATPRSMTGSARKPQRSRGRSRLNAAPRRRPSSSRNRKSYRTEPQYRGRRTSAVSVRLPACVSLPAPGNLNESGRPRRRAACFCSVSAAAVGRGLRCS